MLPPHVILKGQLPGGECWLESPSVGSSVSLNACPLFLLLVELTFTMLMGLVPHQPSEVACNPGLTNQHSSTLATVIGF